MISLNRDLLRKVRVIEYTIAATQTLCNVCGGHVYAMATCMQWLHKHINLYYG